MRPCIVDPGPGRAWGCDVRGGVQPNRPIGVGGSIQRGVRPDQTVVIQGRPIDKWPRSRCGSGAKGGVIAQVDFDDLRRGCVQRGLGTGWG